MATIKDFITNNENVLIIIETAETRNTTDPLRKELWKGMLYDIPKDLQNRKVIQECMNENMLASGIQRQRQRERKHIKDLYCLKRREVTKCIEVRFCDSYEEIFEAAKIKRENYYIDEYESEDAYVL